MSESDRTTTDEPPIDVAAVEDLAPSDEGAQVSGGALQAYLATTGQKSGANKGSTTPGPTGGQ
jgi:hypothetical protein